MFLFRLIAIACLTIAALILFFSNLAPTLPLVFLGRSTVPIAIGTMLLGAIGSGLIISLTLRLLMFGQRPRRQRPAEFSYEPAPETATYRESDREFDQEIDPEFEPAHQDEKPRRRRPIEPDLDPTVLDGVYDASYRVIKQPTPRNAPPEVGSKLRPDSEDWGFDFEDEDEPRK